MSKAWTPLGLSTNPLKNTVRQCYCSEKGPGVQTGQVTCPVGELLAQGTGGGGGWRTHVCGTVNPKVLSLSHRSVRLCMCVPPPSRAQIAPQPCPARVRTTQNCFLTLLGVRNLEVSIKLQRKILPCLLFLASRGSWLTLAGGPFCHLYSQQLPASVVTCPTTY